MAGFEVNRNYVEVMGSFIFYKIYLRKDEENQIYSRY